MFAEQAAEARGGSGSRCLTNPLAYTSFRRLSVVFIACRRACVASRSPSREANTFGDAILKARNGDDRAGADGSLKENSASCGPDGVSRTAAADCTLAAAGMTNHGVRWRQRRASPAGVDPRLGRTPVASALAPCREQRPHTHPHTYARTGRHRQCRATNTGHRTAVAKRGTRWGGPMVPCQNLIFKPPALVLCVSLWGRPAQRLREHGLRLG